MHVAVGSLPDFVAGFTRSRIRSIGLNVSKRRLYNTYFDADFCNLYFTISSYPRRARSALGVDIVLTLDVCLYVCMLAL